MNKALCLVLAVWSVGALSVPCEAQSIMDVLSSKRAGLEDLKSEKSLGEFARRSMVELEFEHALSAWSKLLTIKPKDMYYRLEHAVTLCSLRRYSDGLRELESLKKDCAAAREKYAAIDMARVQAIFGSGNWKSARQESSRLLSEYPGQPGVYRLVRTLNARLKDDSLAKQLNLCLQELNKGNQVARQQIMKVLPRTDKCPSPQEALSLVATTECFPSFKLLLARDKFVGDSGVVKYILRAPNYERVVIFDEESKNFLPLTLDQLLHDHCGQAWFQQSYESVVKVGERKILGFGCDIYKCQFRGESGYHLLALCRDLKVEPGMARALCHFTYAPEANCVPLSLSEYYLGKRRELISIKSLKLVPIQAAAFELGKGYHQVKDMGELMFSEGGAIKESDLDQFLLSPKNAHSKHR